MKEIASVKELSFALVILCTYLSLCQGHTATFTVSTEGYEKRDLDGMHNKILLEMKREDGTVVKTEMTAIKSVETRYVDDDNGLVDDDEEIQDSRVYSSDHNAAIVERKAGLYKIKRASINGIEYVEGEDGVMKSTTNDQAGKLEEQIKDMGRRQTASLSQKYVICIIIVVDFSDYRRWLQDNEGNTRAARAQLRTFMDFTMVGVFWRFKFGVVLPNGFRIHIIFKRLVIIAQEVNQIMGSPVPIGSERPLDRVANWTQTTTRNLDGNDIVIVVVGETSSTVMGDAKPYKICSNNAVGIVACNREGYQALNIARQVAKSIGAVEDNLSDGCDPNENYIMSPNLGYHVSFAEPCRYWRFSNCSAMKLQQSLMNATCTVPMDDETDENRLLDLRPGPTTSKDQQCRDSSFSNSSHSPCKDLQISGGNYGSLCKGMYCTDDNGECTIRIIPLERTRCTWPANNFFSCRSGHCVFDRSTCIDYYRNVFCGRLRIRKQIRACRRSVNYLCTQMNIFRYKL